ncbi:hypothetical protein [Micromonospora sp. NBC_01796]|uniref:hypothetical protein n=1 Tax=Micromonospora sp. NBC_01796 TaxID=2975987 RepID=UPI002DDABD64|nr:hypothetical protein [Micromonospora sp. NBC_01796]WSA88693.1 hypothetical protein OIE47_14420 [Micromonospora sp. NBC_01796]
MGALPVSRWAGPVVRAGLVLLGVLHVSWGIPAVAAPRWFFDHFPGFGQTWTAAYPPFNVHLMTDVGAAFLTLGALLLAAAWLADRRVTRVVLGGVLLFSALHLAFHLSHHGTLAGGGLVASLVSLALGVLAPGALLVLTRWPRA